MRQREDHVEMVMVFNPAAGIVDCGSTPSTTTRPLQDDHEGRSQAHKTHDSGLCSPFLNYDEQNENDKHSKFQNYDERSKNGKPNL
jgi:hypothetical protein